MMIFFHHQATRIKVINHQNGGFQPSNYGGGSQTLWWYFSYQTMEIYSKWITEMMVG